MPHFLEVVETVGLISNAEHSVTQALLLFASLLMTTCYVMFKTRAAVFYRDL